jgi:hypothetical protein
MNPNVSDCPGFLTSSSDSHQNSSHQATSSTLQNERIETSVEEALSVNEELSLATLGSGDVHSTSSFDPRLTYLSSASSSACSSLQTVTHTTERWDKYTPSDRTLNSFHFSGYMPVLPDQQHASKPTGQDSLEGI